LALTLISGLCHDVDEICALLGYSSEECKSQQWCFLPTLSEKHKSASPSAIQVKNQPKTIRTEEELDVISQL
jgi:hypothetical protein